jgi:hypothetical protein
LLQHVKKEAGQKMLIDMVDYEVRKVRQKAISDYPARSAALRCSYCPTPGSTTIRDPGA